MDLLSVDTLSIVVSFLSWKEALNVRDINRKWKEAAALAPISEIVVKNGLMGHDLEWISQALPRVQSILIDFSSAPNSRFSIAEGEDAEPTLRVGMSANCPDASMLPLSRFHQVRHLKLCQTNLNGRFPYLFQFRNLVSLDLRGNDRLKWDLSMLKDMPQLQRLSCSLNRSLTGNLESLRVLFSTLVEVTLPHCEKVSGNLKDIADFPKLEIVCLHGTNVQGDLRELGVTDFVCVKELCVGGGVDSRGNLKTIADAPYVMFSKYLLMKRGPSLFKNRRWRLIDESPERYEIYGHHSRRPPFWVEFVQAGPRIGWRWTNAVVGGSCETHWLDPEPPELDETYIEELKRVERNVKFYKGFLQPPTEDEHAQRSWEVPLIDFLSSCGSPQAWGVW